MSRINHLFSKCKSISSNLDCIFVKKAQKFLYYHHVYDPNSLLRYIFKFLSRSQINFPLISQIEQFFLPELEHHQLPWQTIHILNSIPDILRTNAKSRYSAGRCSTIVDGNKILSNFFNFENLIPNVFRFLLQLTLQSHC